jgi:GT2 family glycosyltransferase
MNQRTSCAVVSYCHEPDEIAPLLASLARCVPPPLLYLVDNSPTPALAQVAAAHHAVYHHQPDNPGFACAHNRALREALEQGSDYHFVVNPDIRVVPDALPPMLAFMEQHRDVGLLAPRVHFPDGRLQPLCKLLPEPVNLAVRRFFPWLHRLRGRAQYEMHSSGYDHVMDVPVLSGCFMLMRCDTLRRVGLFDERFFLYFEDVDLSRRIGRVARTVFFPDVHVEHGYAAGSYRNARLLWHHIVSAVRYFNKWGWLDDPERTRVNEGALRALERRGGAPGFQRRRAQASPDYPAERCRRRPVQQTD